MSAKYKTRDRAQGGKNKKNNNTMKKNIKRLHNSLFRAYRVRFLCKRETCLGLFGNVIMSDGKGIWFIGKVLVC